MGVEEITVTNNISVIIEQKLDELKKNIADVKADVETIKADVVLIKEK